jgi:GNAT superfamily N-acetyltransferase
LYKIGVEEKNMTTWTIRPAQLKEIDALNELIHVSARTLSRENYTLEEINGLIQFVFGVDSELIQDQTYFVIQKEGVYTACGGWSKRRTLFGSDTCETRESGYLDPNKDAAKIRAFFVHPDYSRQGLARQLINACEKAARESGFKKMELMSTLPGIKFYQAQGYRGETKVDYTLPDGLIVKFLPMEKQL